MMLLLTALIVGCGSSQEIPHQDAPQALKTQPGHELKFDLVKLFLNARAYDVAAPIAQELYQIYPRDPRPPLYMGIILRERRIFKQAERYLLESLKYAPKSAQTYDALGILYGMNRQFKESSDAHQRATQLAPQVSKYWHNLGFARSVRRQYQEAITAYEEALRISPEHRGTYVNLGMTYGVMGRYEEAERALSQVLSKGEVAFNLAMVQEKRGDLKEAYDNLQRALEAQIKPQVSRGALNRIKSLIDQRGVSLKSP